MEHSRLFVGAFDLFNIGHLTQLNEVAASGSHVTAVVVSDAGVIDLLDAKPFLPQDERSAVVSQLRMVDATYITGPESQWTLPHHDQLFVDAAIWDQLVAAGVDIEHAFAVTPTRMPTNAALLSAVNAA